ncbi:metallophosphoesterase [Riemerella columbina]|uniref:metallophosphoesterase n=1 Tax=Riemerella columbina TaxID=103810 RepID=UPI00146DF660|nr:metallophosphoesterase [Riemerella columbina]
MGKITHFRKHGLSVPQQVAIKDLERLSGLVDEFQPKKLVIAGDFFHAEANSELALFADWREQNPNVSVILVKGNHDRLAKGIYQSLGIEVYEE